MTRAGRVVIRVAIAGAAVALAVTVAGWRSEEDRCQEAGAQVVRVTGRAAPPDTLPPALRRLEGDCHESAPILVAVGALTAAGRDRPAARLARLAVRREPENWRAWALLSGALGPLDPAAANRARRRALELNPRAGR